MTVKDKIILNLKTGRNFKVSDLTKIVKASRQTISKQLKYLVDQGLVEKTGSTKNSVYRYASKKREPKINNIKIIKNLKNLEEGKVFDEVDLRLNLKKSLADDVYRIITYAFEEMLNNAIDHSKSQKASMAIAFDNQNIWFEIKDSGIGIFANIKKTFKLKDEYEALEHLLKGKQTTFPERHSGQGIFFTSKIADQFQIRSHKILVTFDNKKKDLRTAVQKQIKGTQVSFILNRNSKKTLTEIFKQYANADFEFDRTSIRIKLTAERELLSRSQARRLLFGLEEYKKITFDFKNVKEIGQAFVDEIFRVYQNKHPNVRLDYTNANDAVHFMIRRGT